MGFGSVGVGLGLGSSDGGGGVDEVVLGWVGVRIGVGFWGGIGVGLRWV